MRLYVVSAFSFSSTASAKRVNLASCLSPAQRGRVGECALNKARESVSSNVSGPPPSPAMLVERPFSAFDTWSHHLVAPTPLARLARRREGVRAPGLVEQGRCWPSQAEAASTRPVVGPTKGRAPSMFVVDCARGGGATMRRRRPDQERARHIG
jgi:hypothetical protein